MRRTTFLPGALLLLIAAAAAGQPSAVTDPKPPESAVTLTDETVLMRNSRITVTKADYDAELLRLPADIRGGFGVNPDRVSMLVNNLITTKSLAAASRAQGIDQDRDVQRRIASEVDRILAAALIERFEIDAAREFDARPGMEAVARERYLAGRSKYQMPEQVTVTHILFEVPKHPSDEARKLATDARARIVAGTDMNALAKEISEDPSARRNDGKLDWFAREQMDPVFAQTAFALKNVGDVSEPVFSRFGWHVIRLDGRRAGGVRAFEDVKPEILAELRRAYIDERRAARIAELRNDPKTEINDAAIEQLLVRPDPELIKRATGAAKP